ncbi:MAG: helix-turn-helix transcriptional regulator [Solobacterium sp.]|nr:helix-turn-helix transcriptional regulator [Solobacterium sp.]
MTVYLGKIIKEYRDDNKLSMDDFANKTGLSKPYIAMLEKNYNPKSKKEIIPTVDTIAKCAKAMDIEFNDLFNVLRLSNSIVTNFEIDNRIAIVIEMMQNMTIKDRNKTLEVIKAMFPDLYKEASKY